ncbi:spore germination protein [Paenibacillus sp. TAB 01]|uniref:spore germination protein n=1 Tax=Paenibacillus sp. TAB 01 TaxID=3368988 RepID=UPI0037514C68
MSSMTSLGSSYLTPVAPMKWNDWRDVFIRAPLWMIKDRPSQPKSPNPVKNKMRK